MRKIFLVIAREYATRVKKPSFWILTILVPVLMVALYSIPILIALKPAENTKVVVVDDTRIFSGQFQSTQEVTFQYTESLDYAKRMLQEEEKVTAVVYIPARETTIPNDAFLYYLADEPSLSLKEEIDHQLQTILHNRILQDVNGISEKDFEDISQTRIRLRTKDIETGRDSFVEVKSIIGIVLSLIIFIAIFSFGSQVMRGITEEKSNRIMEVMVTSVKPFQLMMGKIIGICLVGLTQFCLWIVLCFAAFGAVRSSNAELFARAEESMQITEIATKGTDATAQLETALESEAIPEVIQGLTSIHFGLLISMFLLFFLFGYFLYASLFAAIGAIADPETDSQQFILPVMAPLILIMLLFPAMMDAPSGTLATWCSIIPFTSPVAMMLRLPFGVPFWQLILSVTLLVIFFPLCTWISAKIYRLGILQYGKITYSTLFRWLKNDKRSKS